MYQELPKGVAFPKSIADIQNLVKKANKEHFSITARSAGTSLAGQTTGSGVIMDVSKFMTKIVEIDPENKKTVVEPGVIRDSLNGEAGEHNLLFGPDTSTTNRCMIGGMIGNNSSGSFSIKYKTTREHVLSMDVVLSDGSRARFEPLTLTELEKKKKLGNLEGSIYRGMLSLLEKNKDLIRNNYPHPEIIRRNTGYALDKLLEMEPFSPGGKAFNLCELLCGSEGTLAMTGSAILNLVETDSIQKIVIPHFNTIHESMLATIEAVKYDPSAVELIDDIILNATKGNPEQSQNRFFLDKEPKSILVVQFTGNDEAEIDLKIDQLIQSLSNKGLGYSFPVLTDVSEMKSVFDLRKAGLGLLMGLGKEARSPTFCEDTAVRVQDLPEYVKRFQKILDKHKTTCVFYAHASVGELHLRPMIDTMTDEGIEKMKVMAEEIAELVGEFRGSLSGEHGDGRARAPYIEKVLGKEMMPLLKQVKEIWDPNYIFNPGKIIDAKPIEEDLRFSPEYFSEPVHTEFHWRKEGGLNEALELCNGAGVCRKLSVSGGTMCPSYMATTDEKDSTRGRANVFRQVFEGKEPDRFKSKELKEALDLCLSCKACKSECPANVDMAKMKAEFMNGWHQNQRSTFGESFFVNSSKLYPMAALFPGFSNWISSLEITKKLLENIAGISSSRTLPEFSEQTFRSWWKSYKKKEASKKVALVVDLFTNYHEPEVAKSAVFVLEKMGFQVIVPKVEELGRPHLSKGFLKEAKQVAHDAISELKEFADNEIPLIGLEPSEILTVKDEFLDLCDAQYLKDAHQIAKYCYTFEEFMASNIELLPESKFDESVIVHEHCHAKALTKKRLSKKVLEHIGYTVTELDSGCCGMAGSFGYEKDKFDLSMEIGSQRLFPAINEDKNRSTICASGFSCRHQIFDGTGTKAKHITQLISDKI
ncbi:MAG: FAD-binding protein [Balneola sp.]|nr:FAD-binding protein [Balneola sp.]MBO6650538.1 FAD-binding protein [Balneola sp.]MBO6711535.1 FAD-binding protein [Balneola sp.]MBO6799731.1 FAD-binding protein [Balneola sp.]MBO6870828.1 FAD-binding protein [Balneola sp.]